MAGDRNLLFSQVEEKLLAYIQSDDIVIGQRIPNEYTLAETFHAGRGTIREVVKSLAIQGYLEVRRGSGTYVLSKQCSQNDLRDLTKAHDQYQMGLDLFDVRLLIEPELAAWACIHSSQEDKERLERLRLEIEQLYLNGENHLPKDVEFHTWIAHCSGNRAAEILIPYINNSITVFDYMTHRRMAEETIRTHYEITQAILKGNVVSARCAMITHLNSNRKLIYQLINAMPGTQIEKKCK